MSGYRTEEEQVKAIKDWWHENGKSIIAGIVIGLAAIFSWRSYDNHTRLQAEAASILYDQMLSASRQDDLENTRVYADRIIEDHRASTYAIFAKLILAKLAIEANDLSVAEDHLRWVLANNTQTEIGHIIRLRLARVLIASDQLEPAAELLLVDTAGNFIAQYEELRGDIFMKQGKDKEAQQAYQKALTNIATNDGLQSILKMKLDNLGRI